MRVVGNKRACAKTEPQEFDKVSQTDKLGRGEENNTGREVKIKKPRKLGRRKR